MLNAVLEGVLRDASANWWEKRHGIQRGDSQSGSRLRGHLNGPLRPVYHRIPTGAGLRALFTGPPGSGYPHIATLEGNSNDGQTGSPSSKLLLFKLNWMSEERKRISIVPTVNAESLHEDRGRRHHSLAGHGFFLSRDGGLTHSLVRVGFDRFLGWAVAN